MLHNKQIVQALPVRLVIVLLACAWITPVRAPPAPPESDSTKAPNRTTVAPAPAAATRVSSPSASLEKTPTTNVSVSNGSIVDLSCSVATDSRSAVIVWLQGEDFKVLFYGSNRVTDDKRMSVRILVEEGATKSTLRIEPVRQEDQGKFICRVPRKDHIYTEVIQLSVKVAPTLIPTTATSSLSTQASVTNDTMLPVTSR